MVLNGSSLLDHETPPPSTLVAGGGSLTSVDSFLVICQKNLELKMSNVENSKLMT